MIVKTEAIVLRSMKYRETSKIVTLYTRKFGKLSAVAKGARDMKNKFGAALEPMSYVSIVLYKKENRELQLLTQSALIKPFLNLTNHIERLAVGMSIVELMNQVMHDEEENELLFRLLVDTLDTLNDVEKNYDNLLYGFQLRLATLLGFKPEFTNCTICGETIVTDSEKIPYDLSRGGGLCARCAEHYGSGHVISLQGFRVLERLSSTRMDALTNIVLSERLKTEVEETLMQYLKYHIEGLQNLKTMAVFAKMV